MRQQNRKHLDEWIMLWRSFELFYYRFLRKYDLSLNSFQIMTLLMRNPEGIEPSLIAEKLGILRQALAPLLNALEKRGFITRRERNDDHRSKRIVITPEGSAFVQEVEKEMSTLELKAFSSMPDEELDRMFESMSRFLKSLSVLNEDPSPEAL